MNAKFSIETFYLSKFEPDADFERPLFWRRPLLPSQVLRQRAFRGPSPCGGPAGSLHRHAHQRLGQRRQHAVGHHFRQGRNLGAAAAARCRQLGRNGELPGTKKKKKNILMAEVKDVLAFMFGKSITRVCLLTVASNMWERTVFGLQVEAALAFCCCWSPSEFAGANKFKSKNWGLNELWKRPEVYIFYVWCLNYYLNFNYFCL